MSRFLASSILSIVVLIGCASPSASPPPSAAPSPTLQPSAEASPTPTRSIGIPVASVTPSADAASWLDAGDLVEPRNAAHVVVLGTGEVLVVGSDWASCGASTNGSDSVEIGDPQTGAWETTTSLPNLRDAPAVVALTDGRGLVTGGAAGEDVGWSAYSSTYVFDPTTRQWSRSGLLNTARTAAAAAVLLDGRVLVAGGLYMDRTSSEPARALDDGELWDPRSGAWSRTGGLGGTRFGASPVILADGRVLIVGGSSSLESAPIQQAAAEIYDPRSGQWNSAGTLATARSAFALVALPDGGALVAGGTGGLGTTAYELLSAVERFDPVSNTWSTADELAVPVAGATGIQLADGQVLLAGGSVRDPELVDDTGAFVSGMTADAWLFDPETGAWSATTPMPRPRAGASAVLLADGSVLFAGGSAAEGNPGDTPSCPVAEPQVVRYVPGS